MKMQYEQKLPAFWCLKILRCIIEVNFILKDSAASSVLMDKMCSGKTLTFYFLYLERCLWCGTVACGLHRPFWCHPAVDWYTGGTSQRDLYNFMFKTPTELIGNVV